MLVQDIAAFLYADGVLVSSPHPKRLQRLFGVLVDLFNQVGLWKNWRKMVSMD